MRGSLSLEDLKQKNAGQFNHENGLFGKTKEKSYPQIAQITQSGLISLVERIAHFWWRLSFPVE
jgi:hypothetical protein